MAEVRELLDKAETEARIEFFLSELYPLLKSHGLMNEKELAANPDLLHYGDKIAMNSGGG
jgi:hypothetical protein